MSTIGEKLLRELRSGKYYGVFIDDTGSPGLATEKSLNPNRKTWVAVIVQPEYMMEIMNQMPLAISELKAQTGATEFHFSKIYSGSKQFKNISIEVRDGLINFMGHIFDSYDIRILNQTFDPTHIQRWKKDLSKFNLLPHFKIDDHAHLSLLFLLFKLKRFLDSLDQKALVFIDEGIKKSGTCVIIPQLGDRFYENMICFADSSEIMPLQLADFAAWWLNRMQLINDKGAPTVREIDLLRNLNHMSARYSDVKLQSLDINGDDA